MLNESNKITQSQKILQAAFTCISSKGYANVSLRDIADEAGVVLSQLNYYFTNKEGLFIEVVKMSIQNYLTEVEINLKKYISPKARMNYLIKYFRNILIKNPALFRVLFDFTSLALWSESFCELIRNLFKDFSELIETHIINNTKNDKIKMYSPAVLSRMLLGALYGTSIQAILDDKEENIINSLEAIQIIFEL